MDFQKFIESMAEEVQELLGEQYSVRVKSSEKLNGVILNGIGISEKGGDVEKGIYLEDIYESGFLRGGKSTKMLALEVKELYMEDDCEILGAVKKLLDWNFVKQNLYCQIINTEKNHEFIKNSPNRAFLDMTITYYIKIGEKSDRFMRITNEHMQKWGQDEENLYKQAMENVQKQISIKDLNEELREAVLEAQSEEGTVYICSNISSKLGAVTIACESAIAELRERLGDNFLIIPASTDHIICSTMKPEKDWDRLTQVIQAINVLMISPEEFLSDHLYGYVDGEIRILR